MHVVTWDQPLPSPSPPPILELAQVHLLDQPRFLECSAAGYLIGPTTECSLANDCPVGSNVLIPGPHAPTLQGLDYGINHHGVER